MERHPLCDWVPEMEVDERSRLMESVKENGPDPLFPVVTLDGKILDGYHRWTVYQKLKIKEFPIVEWKPVNKDDSPEAFVLRACVRRNLSKSQQAMVKARFRKQIIDERPTEPYKKPRFKKDPNCTPYERFTPEEKVKFKAVQKTMRTSARLDQMANVVMKTPLAEKVVRGEIPLHVAHKEIKKSQCATVAHSTSDPNSGPPERPRDHAGNIVRDPRLRAALACEGFGAVAKAFGALKREITALADGDAGWALKAEWQAVVRELDAASHRVKSAAPWAGCPLADNCDDRKCPACCGTGWTTKDKYGACKP